MDLEGFYDLGFRDPQLYFLVWGLGYLFFFFSSSRAGNEKEPHLMVFCRSLNDMSVCLSACM